MKNELIEARKNNGFTQTEAAAFLGVSLRSYKSYEIEIEKQRTIKYKYFVEQLKNNACIGKESNLLTIKAITEENFIDAFNLKLKKEQEKYVSNPIRSLAQAYVYRNQCQPFGIYINNKMIGYVMVIYDYDVPEYDIWHMMIDKSMQNRGYGSQAIDKILDYIKTKPFGNSNRVVLTCNKNNTSALKLYANKGFKETGQIDGDEIELVKMM